MADFSRANLLFCRANVSGNDVIGSGQDSRIWKNAYFVDCTYTDSLGSPLALDRTQARSGTGVEASIFGLATASCHRVQSISQ